jgi:vacuolar-type H+-ATPase catalytic subunit A/Vma1
MANPFFSGRIPQELFDRVEKHVQEAGESKTNILVQALAAYLNFPIQVNKASDSNLERRVQELEQQAIKLLSLDKDIYEIKQIILSQSQVDNSVITTDNDEDLDKLPLLKNYDNSVIDTDNNSEKWKLIGEMTITEILKLPNLEIQDETKFRNMLKGLKSSNKEKVGTVGSYRIEVIGQKPGTKGKVIYRVSDNSDN